MMLTPNAAAGQATVAAALRRNRWPNTAAALLAIGILLLTLMPLASTHAAAHPVVNTANTSNNTAKAIKVSASSPTWAELTTEQQQVLAPLASDWNKLKPFHKKKWLEISNRYALMQPAEQARLQERMREWTKLTPDQRRIVRENYALANKLDTEQRALRWQQYQQLSEQQKKELAAQAVPHHKRVTTLPPRAKTKPASPIKLTPPASDDAKATAPAGHSAAAPAAPVIAPATK